MIKLIPDWAINYDEYLDSIRNRNLWFIHIRYAAVLMLVAIILISIYVLKLDFTQIQIRALLLVTLVILLYNILLHRTRSYLNWSKLKFNPLHFSLVQIVLDLIALTFVVHFTGTIETPLYMLYIFHMIIGSLILPQRVILSIAFILVVSFTGVVLGEYYSVIPHYHIAEIHIAEFAQNFNFIITSLCIFIFTIFTTVGITSRIAKRLYRREQELKESLEKIDELEITKQTYIMGVVHEIKSPIVASQSIIELIKNGYLGEINKNVKNKLERVIKRNEEALNLINNILRISKLKLIDEFSIEKIDIKKIIEKIIEQKSDSIRDSNLSIEINADGYENVMIDGDKMLFELIFSNVIGNAVKYSNKNGKILIELENFENKIKIEVSDNGIGIPQNEIKMIFRQFYRASNLRTKKIDGSGLGLALVKEIVNRFNGEITIVSPANIGDDKNPGTTVSIILPITQS